MGEFGNITSHFAVRCLSSTFTENVEMVLNIGFPFSGVVYGKEAYENRDFPARGTSGQI